MQVVSFFSIAYYVYWITASIGGKFSIYCPYMMENFALTFPPIE